MEAYDLLTSEERRSVVLKYTELANNADLDFSDEEKIIKETELWLRSIKEVGLYEKLRKIKGYK